MTTIEEAKVVMSKLYSPEGLAAYHACDTEVMDIDLKTVGPVGNGRVTCFSMYSGPGFDYGFGEGQALFVDNIDASKDLMQVFKPFFEDERFKKVWHNYGFDRHVMFNEGIDCKGFAGDTMHMARLEDSSRMKFGGGGGGYSLEALTEDLLGRRKRPMKEIFGVAKLKKDGTPGAIIELPAIEAMQRNPETRAKWIAYAAYDAEGTWLIREKLAQKLTQMPWIRDKNLYEFYELYLVPFGECLTDMERRGVRVDAGTYLAGIEVQAREDKVRHSEIFRSWAAEIIGPDGLAMNPGSAQQLATFLFGGAINEKTQEPIESTRTFSVPRTEVHPEGLEALKKRDFDAAAASGEDTTTDEFDVMTAVQLKAILKENGLKMSGKKSELQERLRNHFLSPPPSDEYDDMTEQDLKDACAARGLDTKGTKKKIIERLREDSAYALELISGSGMDSKSVDGYKTVSEALAAAAHREGVNSNLATIMDDIKNKSTEKKNVDVTITSIHMTPKKFTAGGAPSVTADVLRELAGDPFDEHGPKYGSAYEFFGGGEEGRRACVALYSLTQMGSIDTMIANFVVPLQYLADDQSRVHCSLNLNTETGRLSARRPNLQNQPALEKDKYKIRKAFQASPGNQLIVADYGQLELRLLASMTNCKSMIDAFIEGGDFHSRTAMGMFDYIKEKVDKGEVLFEWDYSKGDPPAPMLKDEYGSERRKAKTLNFSIAYGKTAHGLSKDWGVTVQEAEKMLNAWYADRPEVLRWQKAVKATARSEGLTRTLMGRYRMLPEATTGDRRLVGHAERASINTPIQGGAADVAMMAMIKINKDERLKRLGWILLMQVHDEVILEGPEETADEAFGIVTDLMQNPWDLGLEKTKVELLVDGSSAGTWYEAK